MSILNKGEFADVEVLFAVFAVATAAAYFTQTLSLSLSLSLSAGCPWAHFVACSLSEWTL